MLVQLLLLFSIAVNAQTNSVSPYSRYALGELRHSGFSHQAGMGRAGTAVYSNEKLNFINPASLSFDTIATIEAGLRGEVTKLQTEALSQTANDLSISYLAVGFPVIKNCWGAAFGLIPYSDVGYNISDQQTIPDIGRVNYSYLGDGGINRFLIGNGFAPFSQSVNKFHVSDQYKTWLNNKDTLKIQKKERWLNFIKGFSIGVNASWIFGTINHIRKIEFIDSTNFLNTRMNNSYTLGDFYFNYGILYTKEIKNDYFINLGITGSGNSSIKSTNNSLWYNYRLTSFEFENIKDTAQFIEDQKGNTALPMYWNAGFTYGKKNKWLVTAETSIQDWSSFSLFENNDSLENSLDIALGTEIIPNYIGVKYFQRIQYRFGARYSKSYLSINNNSITDYGLTVGFGFPLSLKKDRVQRASLHIAFEAGQKGTTENNLLKEQYLRFQFGIVLNESWFQKRKYD
ncbi:MAG: hypothetical protein ACHQNT_09690 [Bacteroidia bacterium]